MTTPISCAESVAELALSLSKGAREVLPRMRAFHHARDFLGMSRATAREVRRLGIATMNVQDAYRLTPLGLAVRAHLAPEQPA